MALLFAPRKILVAHSGLGPWAVRNVPASRASEWSNYQIYRDLLGFHQQEYGKKHGNMEYVCFFYSKMALLSIQATDMPFQWIHSMDRCEPAMEDIRRPQVYQTFGQDLNIAWNRNPIYLRNYVTKRVYYASIYIYVCINEKLEDVTYV